MSCALLRYVNLRCLAPKGGTDEGESLTFHSHFFLLFFFLFLAQTEPQKIKIPFFPFHRWNIRSGNTVSSEIWKSGKGREILLSGKYQGKISEFG